MKADRRLVSGLTLLEVVIAMALLALIAVMLSGSIMVISRRTIVSTDNQARAGNLASRYLEVARATIRVSSLMNLPATAIITTETLEGMDYNVSTSYVQGRILIANKMVGGIFYPAGSFYDGEGLPVDADGQPASDAAVRVDVIVTWNENGVNKLLPRSCILVPRLH